ncbi:MAG: DUF4258 domain-containing protein [Sphingobacteriia bacterium]|nr:DUF4258 domain-containing protein [Sphingobacteriia bacterium]
MQQQTQPSTPIAGLHTWAITEHARLRMSQRGIGQDDVGAVLRLGRCQHSRGARFYFVGCKEVQRYAQQGLNIRRLENLQVLLAPHSDDVITVYRSARLPRS